MSGSRRQLVAIPSFACLLFLGAKTVREFGVESSRDDPKSKVQGSALPLNTMDGFEVLGISEKGAAQVKIQSGLATIVVVAPCGLSTPTARPGRWAVPRFSRSSRDLISKTATLKLKLPVSRARELSQAREDLSGLRSGCKIMDRGMRRSICV